MSAESSLFDTLSVAAGVTAIVSDRIYPDVIPENKPVPAISFQRTATEFVNTIHGTVPVCTTPTLEISCVDRTRAAANALANAVVSALAGTSFYAIDQQAAVDFESELWGAIVVVNFSEST